MEEARWLCEEKPESRIAHRVQAPLAPWPPEEVHASVP